MYRIIKKKPNSEWKDPLKVVYSNLPIKAGPAVRSDQLVLTLFICVLKNSEGRAQYLEHLNFLLDFTPYFLIVSSETMALMMMSASSPIAILSHSPLASEMSNLVPLNHFYRETDLK